MKYSSYQLSLLPFCIARMSRNEDHSSTQCSTHFFSTHFFTTLMEQGVNSVRTWTFTDRGLVKCDVFSTKIIFVPVNYNHHWSLCCIVNPGLIANWTASSNETLEAPHIIHLDSGRGKNYAHDSRKLSGVLRNWLNVEWHRLHPTKESLDLFNESSMPLLLPKGNSCDVMFPGGQCIFRKTFLIYPCLFLLMLLSTNAKQWL